MIFNPDVEFTIIISYPFLFKFIFIYIHVCQWKYQGFFLSASNLKKPKQTSMPEKKQLTDYEGKGSGGITQMHLTSYK